MPTFFQTKSFLNYWLDAVDEHSLHSPFLFDLYTRVVRRPSDLSSFDQIENLRKKLLSDTTSIEVDDLGSGPQSGSGTFRLINDIAAKSLSTQKFSSLYYRVIQHFGSRKIIELGTSLGINTLYLSQGDNTSVTTFEGSKAIGNIARSTFEFAGRQNINMVEGNIDNTLPAKLPLLGKLDFIFIDANHRYSPTKKYFDWLLPQVHPRSVMVFDDIHYTSDMEKAWNEVRSHELVYTSIDLYRCGMLFFDPSLNKQHAVLQF